MKRAAPIVVLALAIFGVIACAPGPADREIDPQPENVGRLAPTAPAPRATLPLTWQHARLAVPGWDDMPVEHGGFFVGISVKRSDNALQFIVVDSSGEIRWRAERPPTCTGFTLSWAGDRPIAVLTDTGNGPRPDTVSASAYDLATGARLWGPVTVPGPYQGPGLVFAAPAPASAMGTTGARRALNPRNGRTVAEEKVGTPTAVIGEYDGTVLVSDGAVLRALDAESGELRWRRSIPRPGLWSSALPQPSPPGAALLGEEDARHGTLLDLSDGSIIDTGVRQAAWADGTDVWVTVTDNAVRAHRDGALLWERESQASTELAATDPVLVYLRVGNRVQPVNTLTGEAAIAYPSGHPAAGYAVPALVSPTTSAAVTRADGRILLLTTRQPS